MVKSYSPVILSAGRATDIPAFYGDWLLNRLKEGYIIKRNPFNNLTYKISFENVQLIVFWTKNPAPFIEKFTYLNDYYPNYYFQFTLNDYDETIEQNLPSLTERIETFINLSKKIGKEKVIWRFDPLILSDKLTVNDLVSKIEKLAKKLNKYTNKFVFSFVDINNYKKVIHKVNKSQNKFYEFSYEQKVEFAQKISKIFSPYSIEISTCAEDIDLTEFGITKNKCIDDNLIKEVFKENENLMAFVNQNKNLKDKGQRKNCGCIQSKDIGMYNTCIHSCVYCYAGSSNKRALNNYQTHINSNFRESII